MCGLFFVEDFSVVCYIPEGLLRHTSGPALRSNPEVMGSLLFITTSYTSSATHSGWPKSTAHTPGFDP